MYIQCSKVAVTVFVENLGPLRREALHWYGRLKLNKSFVVIVQMNDLIQTQSFL